jgi:hypothetical protein
MLIENKMPVKITKMGNRYEVATLFKSGEKKSIKAKGTTKKKAEAQARLLRAIEKGFVRNR